MGCSYSINIDNIWNDFKQPISFPHFLNTKSTD